MDKKELLDKVREDLNFPHQSMDYIRHKANSVGEVNSLEVMEYINRLEHRILDLEIEAKRSFDILRVYGVSKDRAKSISNGIEVLATRYIKEIECFILTNK